MIHHEFPLVAVSWDDATNIPTWEDLDGIAGWARTGGWRVTNVGYLVHEDDDCVVIAARAAFDAEPRQVGLFERIPKRAITHRVDLSAELHDFKPEPMSQLCRDGSHAAARIGNPCSGCSCLCHNLEALVNGDVWHKLWTLVVAFDPTCGTDRTRTFVSDLRNVLEPGAER